MQTKETRKNITNRRARQNAPLKAAAGCLAAALLAGSAAPLPASADVWFGLEIVDGKHYWYEDGIRQGYDPQNPHYRGKEIYDPASDAWYWLDNIQKGAKAVSKDVYQESAAGIWAENQENGTGKWVRYNSEGHMIKGWHTNENGTYYFDLIFGTMAKGTVTIDGRQYQFDQYTGILAGTEGGSQTGTPDNGDGSGSSTETPGNGGNGSTGGDPLAGIIAGNAYVLNTHTKKIHHWGCQDIAKILEKNYYECGNTLDSLISLGYDTCGHCWH